MRRAIRLVKWAIKHHQIEMIPKFIENRNLKDVKLELPAHIDHEVTRILFDKEMNISFLDPEVVTHWNDIDNITKNLKFSNQLSTVCTANVTLRRYLDLHGVEYKLRLNQEHRIAIHDLPSLATSDIAREVFINCLYIMKFHHVRVMLECGFVPTPRDLQCVTDMLILSGSLHHLSLFLLLPLSLSDEQICQCVVRLSNPWPRRDSKLIVIHYYMFYDSVYDHVWAALRRQLNNDKFEFHPYIVRFINTGELPEAVKFSYKIFEHGDGYPITNYNHIVIRSNSDDVKFKFFRKLVKNAYTGSGLCYDSRLIPYWKKFCQPEYKEKLEKLLIYYDEEPVLEMIEYLDYLGLRSEDDVQVITEDTRFGYKLIEMVVNGQIKSDHLHINHPLNSFIRSRRTKSAMNRID